MIRLASLGCSVLAVTFVLVTSQDCHDGEVCCMGCRAYQLCEDGEWEHVECDYPHTVFNYAVERCTPISEAPPPCGDYRNCTVLPDMSFPDMATNCTFFFTCLDGENLGLQMCNPGTVFNIEKQVCDWPNNVTEPCGTIPAMKKQRRTE